MKRTTWHPLIIVPWALLIVAAACVPTAASSAISIKDPQVITGIATAEEATKPTVEATGPSASETSPTAAKPTGNPVKIGLITPLIGRFADHGARQKIAILLGVEDVNHDGGINGSPLGIVMVDDAANPQEDETLVRRLANEDKVVAIVGLPTNSSFEAAAPLANKLQVPLVTANSTKPGITDQNRPWVFRFSIVDAAVVPVAIKGFMTLYPNARRIVITGDAKEPVNEHIIKNIFPKALKDAGLAVIDTVPFDTGTTDFSAIVSKIKSLNPLGIAFSSLTPEAVGMAKEFQRQGVKAPVLASFQNWSGPEIILAKDLMEGWVTSGTFDENTQDPFARAYLERFVKIAEADPAVRKPVYAGIWTQTYDMIKALAEVLRGASVSPDMDIQKARKATQEGIQNLKGFKGITGEISMLPNGDITTTPLPFVARRGKWVPVK
ncbi:MAG: ABC transporter substrate-binding protein [Dehalococcoidia bacterium]|nr:ABC transporter substrate-binding protein [Dehalococcoidia bacterium]